MFVEPTLDQQIDNGLPSLVNDAIVLSRILRSDRTKSEIEIWGFENHSAFVMEHNGRFRFVLYQFHLGWGGSSFIWNLDTKMNSSTIFLFFKSTMSITIIIKILCIFILLFVYTYTCLCTILYRLYAILYCFFYYPTLLI